MPWAVAKGHDSFLPLSEPFGLGPGEDWRGLRLWLDVNGERRQACVAGTARRHGQSGRLAGATSGHHGLLRLHLKA